MTRRSRSLLFVAALAFVPARASAQEDGAPIEHTIVVGVGGAAELDLGDGALARGTNVMLEWDAIEDWLELELEASLLAADDGVEIPIGALAKKPFHLTRWAEVMIGVGPELVRVSTPSTKATYLGVQGALDFMFWPSARLGFWIEPSYDVVFGASTTHGIGSTGGLLVGW